MYIYLTLDVNDCWDNLAPEHYRTKKKEQKIMNRKKDLFPIFKILGYFWVLRGHVGAMHISFPEPLYLN